MWRHERSSGTQHHVWRRMSGVVTGWNNKFKGSPPGQQSGTYSRENHSMSYYISFFVQIKQTSYNKLIIAFKSDWLELLCGTLFIYSSVMS